MVDNSFWQRFPRFAFQAAERNRFLGCCLDHGRGRRWPACRVASMGGQETCPLPEDPVLAAMATALNNAGQWAEIADPEGRVIYMTDEARLIYGGRVGLARVPLGLFSWGAEANRIKIGVGRRPVSAGDHSQAIQALWAVASGGDPRRREVLGSGWTPSSTTSLMRCRRSSGHQRQWCALGSVYGCWCAGRHPHHRGGSARCLWTLRRQRHGQQACRGHGSAHAYLRDGRPAPL